MRTQLRNFFRCRHKLAPIGLFFRPKARAKLGGSPEKPRNISYLDDAQFFFPKLNLGLPFSPPSPARETFSVLSALETVK